MLKGVQEGKGTLSSLAALCVAKAPNLTDYLRDNIFCNSAVTPHGVTVEAVDGSHAIYIYLVPLKHSIRTITRSIDVQDGTVWIAVLDLDEDNHPIGLELITHSNVTELTTEAAK